MSYLGQCWRGAKWYAIGRTADGLIPEIANDPHKMRDVNVYLASVEKDKVDVDYSSKTKKELFAECAILGIDTKDATTKDDLIVLLENKSDNKISAEAV